MFVIKTIIEPLTGTLKGLHLAGSYKSPNPEFEKREEGKIYKGFGGRYKLIKISIDKI